MRAAPLSLHTADSKFRLPVRRTPEDLDALILDLLARSNRPISAYDISHRSMDVGRPVERGLVHRVESLSAYMLRQQSFDGCMICDQCHTVQLLSNPEVISGLEDCAQRLGFAIERTVVELHGHCGDCEANIRATGDHEAALALPTVSSSPIVGV